MINPYDPPQVDCLEAIEEYSLETIKEYSFFEFTIGMTAVIMGFLIFGTLSCVFFNMYFTIKINSEDELYNSSVYLLGGALFCLYSICSVIGIIDLLTLKISEIYDHEIDE